MMTYREDLIFVTHMKFDFVSGVEVSERDSEKKDNHGTYTSIIVQVNMYIREHARLCVIILLVCKVKGNKDNGDLTQEGQIDHPSFLLCVYVYVSLALISV